MPISVFSPALTRVLYTGALFSACLFIATVPFRHVVLLRLVTLAAAVLLIWAQRGFRLQWKLPLLFPWALWGALAAFSVVFAEDRTVALGEMKHEILYTFLAYATWYELARRPEGARWLAITLAATVMAVLAIGAVHVVRAGLPFTLGDYGDVGTISTFNIAVLPVLLALALRAPPASWQRAGIVLLVTGCLAGGALTQNRMFGIAAGIEIIVFALFSMRNWHTPRRSLWMLGVAGIVAVLALASLFASSQWRIELYSPGRGVVDFIAADPRRELWNFALRQIGEHPWIGAGLGKLSSHAVFMNEFHDEFRLHAHNVFLNRALETGLPGLAAFVVLLGSLAYAFWKQSRSAVGRDAALGVAGLALIAGVVCKNLTDDFFIRQNALLFWSLSGAVLGAAAKQHGRSGVVQARQTRA